MPENVGGIEYAVEADTSSLLKSEQIVSNSSNNMASSLGVVDASAKKMTQTISSAPASLNKLTSAVRQANAQAVIMPEAMKRVQEEVRKTGKSTGVLSGLLDKLQKSFKVQKGAAQQAGFQIQDFAVQVQGGTSTLVAFGQQGSQLAGILGPGGAVLGAIIAIASAVGGVLFTALSGAGNEASVLSDKMEALAERTTAYNQAVADANILQLNAALIEQDDILDGLENQLKAAEAALLALGDSTNRYRGAAGDIAALESRIEDLRNTLALEKDTRDILDKTLESNIKNRKNEEGEIRRSKASLDRLIESLDIRARSIIEVDGALKKSARTEAILRAETLGATEAQKAAINTSFDRIEAVDRQAKALRDQARAEADAARESAKQAREAESLRRAAAGRQRTQATRDTGVIDNLKQQLATEEELIAQSQEKQQAAILRQTTSGSQERESLLLASEQLKNEKLLELTTQRLEEQERLEQEAADRKEIAEVEAIEQKFEVDTQTAERLRELALEGENAAQSIRSSFVNALVDVGDSFASTFASAIVQGESLSQAIRGVAASFLTDMLGSLIKVGARMLVNAAIGQSTAAATTAASVASAAAISTAFATPAALVSLASFGANAAPAAAGIASTVALSNGLASAPGLQTGGPIGAGSMRRVNENGPELFTDGARQFLIPDRAGNVVNNGDAQKGSGGAVNLNFNITNTSSRASFEVESVNSDQTEITINAIVADIETGNGPVTRALTNSTNVTSRANA